MDAPTPSEEPAAPVGPPCTACATPAAVSWQRRLNADEVTALVQAEEARRAVLALMADPLFGPPEFGPLPTGEGMTTAVYGCLNHAITLDAASRIHESTCTAPNPADLPGCDCTEETPPHEPLDDEGANPLPDHWTTGT